MRRRTVVLVLLFLVLATVACNEHPLLDLDRAIAVEIIDHSTQLETNAVDVLWVIDNSNSMCQEQRALTENFSAFMDTLVEIGADFRLAVVTTDVVAEGGMFRDGPGAIAAECLVTPPTNCDGLNRDVLAADDYDLGTEDGRAQLTGDFACIATVGTDGGGMEEGLQAVESALSADMLEFTNAGFRRDDAWLAIIFVTDENDCSGGAEIFATGYECEWNRQDLLDVDRYVDFIRNLPGAENGERVFVAGIIGPDDGNRVENPELPRPSCNSDRGDAFSGYRYDELISHFGSRGISTDICHDDFDSALDEIGDELSRILSQRCLSQRPDSDDPIVIVEAQGTDGEWIALDGPDSEAPQFIVNWEANCATRVSVEFTEDNAPLFGTEFRVRYGRSLTEDGGPMTAPLSLRR